MTQRLGAVIHSPRDLGLLMRERAEGTVHEQLAVPHQNHQRGPKFVGVLRSVVHGPTVPQPSVGLIAASVSNSQTTAEICNTLNITISVEQHQHNPFYWPVLASQRPWAFTQATPVGVFVDTLA